MAGVVMYGEPEEVLVDSYEVEVVCDCPDCDTEGGVQYVGTAWAERGSTRCYLLGVPCVVCGREFSLEFDVVCDCADGETLH
jgi:hypothetical protein